MNSFSLSNPLLLIIGGIALLIILYFWNKYNTRTRRNRGNRGNRGNKSFRNNYYKKKQIK
jgi:hypothetical protein